MQVGWNQLYIYIYIYIYTVIPQKVVQLKYILIDKYRSRDSY